MKPTLILSFLLCFSHALMAQIEVRVIRDDFGDISISFPHGNNVSMNTSTELLITTNIDPEDSIITQFDKQPIYNYKRIPVVFSGHEWGVIIGKKINGHNKVLASAHFNMTGPRFLLTVDGDTVTRYEINRIKPDSKIEISLVSGTDDINSISARGYVEFGWAHTEQRRQYVKLNSQYKLSTTPNKLKAFIKGYHPERNQNIMFIALPELYDGANNPLLLPWVEARTYALEIVE